MTPRATIDALLARLNNPPFGTETSERNLFAAAATLLATVAAERDAAVEALINIETAPTSYSSETLRRLARNTLTTIAAAQASAAQDEGE